MTLQIDYQEITAHKHMLGDQMRCQAFRNALRQLVGPESYVLDVGAGTGLLSIFAAQAGAKHVYAVERTETAELAKHIINENGLSDRITVLQEDIYDAELPHKVDLIVSEFLGGCGIEENVVPAVIIARDRWLSESGHLIPRRTKSWIAPVFDDALELDLQFWNSKPYGVDLSQISQGTECQIQPCRYNIYQQHLLSTPQCLWDIDLRQISHARSLQPFVSEQQFAIQRAGQCNALAAWFEAELSDEITLSNRPPYQYTHWGRWVLPIGASLAVDCGDQLAMSLKIEPETVGKASISWHVHLKDHDFDATDTTSLLH